MKLKYEFEKVEMDGQIMAVPIGDSADELHAMLRLNETAAFILDQLKEETTEDKVAEAACKSFEGDEGKIKAYVHDFLGILSEQNFLA